MGRWHHHQRNNGDLNYYRRIRREASQPWALLQEVTPVIFCMPFGPGSPYSAPLLNCTEPVSYLTPQKTLWYPPFPTRSWEMLCPVPLYQQLSKCLGPGTKQAFRNTSKRKQKIPVAKTSKWLTCRSTHGEGTGDLKRTLGPQAQPGLGRTLGSWAQVTLGRTPRSRVWAEPGED